jgi:hypothetical protein
LSGADKKTTRQQHLERDEPPIATSGTWPCPRKEGLGPRPAFEAMAVGRSVTGDRSSPGRSEGIGGGQYSAGMTYGLFGKFSARPGRRDDLVTYLLKAAKLPQRAYEIAGPR